MDEKFKLRIKYPSGAEFEAEGAPDFILKEKESFINNISSTMPADKRIHESPPEIFTKPVSGSHVTGPEFWLKVITHKGNLFILKVKNPSITSIEASFIIIAASHVLGETKEYSAINLSKSLKSSGYLTERLDRLLLGEIKAGNIVASGTKRNRAYHLTPKGLQIAYLAITKLIKNI